MRALNKNKQKMYYALFEENIPITESYIDEEGNEYELPTGEYEEGYGEPIAFKGNIAMSGGEAEAQEFGLNLADYEAILVVSKNTLPLTETSRIWHTTEPTKGINGRVDGDKADYKVVKISPSLNVDKYVLQKVVK